MSITRKQSFRATNPFILLVVASIFISAARTIAGVDFTFTPADGCAPLEVTITDHSTPAPADWKWTFQDGSPSQATGKGPHKVTFANAGTHSITLTVHDVFGGMSSAVKNLQVFLCTGSISGSLFVDNENDGVQGNLDHPYIWPVLISLYSNSVAIMQMQNKLGLSQYMFDHLQAGTYKVRFDIPDGCVASPKDVGPFDQADSDVDEHGYTDPIVLAAGQQATHVDAGFYFVPWTIRGKAWTDWDEDGMQDPGEPGMPDVIVLRRQNSWEQNEYIPRDTTDSQGNYEFSLSGNDQSWLGFLIPVGYSFSPQDQGADDTKDSDVDQVLGRSATILYKAGSIQHELDAGIYPDPTARFDFGDDFFGPTMLMDDGPRHRLPPDGAGHGSYLGKSGDWPDAESYFYDSFPYHEISPAYHHWAYWDDQSGENDENGAYQASMLNAGYKSYVYVFSSDHGILNAWMKKDDYFNDAPDMHVIQDQPVSPGLNPFEFIAPTTYTQNMRFRLSSISGLSTTGPAPDGEVEDHGFYGGLWADFSSFHPDLGDAPQAGMTAYPKGGPAGVVSKYRTSYRNWGEEDPVFQVGPRHLNSNFITCLGDKVTGDIDSMNYNRHYMSPDEDGLFNIVIPADVADLDGGDDGVAVPLVLPACEPVSFTYSLKFVMGAPVMYVNVWIDWNRDGDWEDALDCGGVSVPEWAVQNQGLTGYSAGVHQVTTPSFKAWYEDPDHPKPVWMRITLAEMPWDPSFGPAGSGPIYGYKLGETEDYYFLPLTSANQKNSGSALNPPFPEAFHAFKPGMFLGSLWGGQADSNGAGPDGVSFGSKLIPGDSALVLITASGRGLLNGWIDFNGDGDWSDPGERIFEDRSMEPGLNRLTIFIPPGLPDRGTFARFRFGSERGLGFSGPAGDGEVEDYRIHIGAETNAVNAAPVLPAENRLLQNYPNPFNPATQIEYHLRKTEHVRLVVYNMQGQEVLILLDALRPAGRYMETWHGRDKAGRDVPGGLYLCRIEAGDFRRTVKLLLMK